MTDLFSRLKTLQTLVIIGTGKLPLVESDEGIQVPLSFLVNSLKQLQIGGTSDFGTAVPANQAIWLLCFCPLLRQAIISFSITSGTEPFLKEYHETFSDLSRVKELALQVHYLEDHAHRNTWWGLEWEQERIWKAGTESQKISPTFYW